MFNKPYYAEENTKSHICRIQSGPITVYEDDFLTIDVPDDMQHRDLVITPRKEFSDCFQPRIMSVGTTVSLKNISGQTLSIRRHAQVADLRLATIVDVDKDGTHDATIKAVYENDPTDFKFKPTARKVNPSNIDEIKVDPDNQMSSDMKSKFIKLNEEFSHVFTTTPGRYSGFYGDVSTNLQFTTKPVQNKKVATANHTRDMNLKLAEKMNELYDFGVLMTPGELGVDLEYLSPSLLVPKPDGGWRFVTDFTALNKHLKRLPSVNPTIQEARQDLSRKKYFIELDLSNYFFQGGLRREDTAYLGVQHPFRGPMLYTASPQGLKHSSEVSYDRLARIFGQMTEEGRFTRMADGLFVLADSFEELLVNYRETLIRISNSGLTLKPSKAVIAPKSAIIFSWLLKDGMWTPQDHVVSSLTRAEKPTTVKQMRSFNGAVKQLSQCVLRYGVLLHPLEAVIGPRGSSEKIIWTDALEEAFTKVKKAISKPDSIIIPRRDDKLITSSDFSKQMGAVGGMLTVIRKRKNGSEEKLLGGHFSANLDKGRSGWSTCDGEALGTKLVLDHFAHFVRENDTETLYLTDSMPVVQAWNRMVTGKFSTSPKMTSFLSTLSSLPVRIEHRPGSDMKLTDHASRHPPSPCKPGCDICKYIDVTVQVGENTRVYSLETEEDDFLEDRDVAPYLQMKTWKTIQMNDPIHSRLMHLIKTGQEPEKKKTGGEFTTLKHLHTLFMRNSLKIHKSGVIVVKTKFGHFDGYSISVPEQIFKGLAFIVDTISDACLQCLATQKLPKALIPETLTIPQGLGTNYSANVLERCGQIIFVCKESLSHFVTCSLASDQTIPSMRDALIASVAPTISMTGATVRLDSAPAFLSMSKSLKDDPALSSLRLSITIGDTLNRNHNPLAEAAIGELKRELLNLSVQHQPISQAILSIATRNLNSRIRAEGRSAMELLTGRDALTNKNFVIDDSLLKTNLQDRRDSQHKASLKHNSKTRVNVETKQYSQGDIVMFRESNNLDSPRDTYVVVTDNSGEHVEVRKLAKQLRVKTYRCKREQLILIFSSSALSDHPDFNDPPTPPPTPTTRAEMMMTRPTLTHKQTQLTEICPMTIFLFPAFPDHLLLRQVQTWIGTWTLGCS